jgi:alpha-ketoglutarate-dependent taurine dioxygenase
MAFTLNQISPAGAAEIIGFDCSTPASPADFAALQQAFRDHPILCIRDQHLTPKAQAAFIHRYLL